MTGSTRRVVDWIPVILLVLGTALAFHYNGSRSRFRELLQLVIFLPFLMPPIITGPSMVSTIALTTASLGTPEVFEEPYGLPTS